MTKKEKQERNAKIKSRLLRVLHVIAYVLSLLFIIICIVSGVQSCNKSKPKSQLNVNRLNNYNNINYYAYTLDYNGGGHHLNLDGIYDFYGVNRNLFETANYPTLYKSFSLPVGAEMEVNGVLYNCDSWYFVFTVQEFDNGDYGYFLDSLIGQYYNGYIYVLRGTFENGEDNRNTATYEFSSSKLVLTTSNYQYYPFNRLYRLMDQSVFTFNDSFNYNAPYNLPYGNGLWWSDDAEDLSIDITLYDDTYLGWFISGDMLFDTIKYGYRNSNAMDFINEGEIFNSEKALKGANGYAYYYELVYYNSVSGNSVTVNYRNKYWYESAWGIPGYYYTSGTTWYNDGFRTIYFINELTTEQVIYLQAFNNNNQTNFTGNVIAGNNGTNVFVLLSTGFTALTDFWSIQILPGISIGTLFFLPLVVCIVMTVFYMVNR